MQSSVRPRTFLRGVTPGLQVLLGKSCWSLSLKLCFFCFFCFFLKINALVQRRIIYEYSKCSLRLSKMHLFPQQVYPCSNDKECSVGSYCHSPQQAPSRCLTCRRRKKRCHRDAMCCPGNRCSNCTSWCTSASVISWLRGSTQKLDFLSYADVLEKVTCSRSLNKLYHSM